MGLNFSAFMKIDQVLACKRTFSTSRDRLAFVNFVIYWGSKPLPGSQEHNMAASDLTLLEEKYRAYSLQPNKTH